jgi:hypothetical protein
METRNSGRANYDMPASLPTFFYSIHELQYWVKLLVVLSGPGRVDPQSRLRQHQRSAVVNNNPAMLFDPVTATLASTACAAGAVVRRSRRVATTLRAEPCCARVASGQQYDGGLGDDFERILRFPHKFTPVVTSVYCVIGG